MTPDFEAAEAEDVVLAAAERELAAVAQVYFLATPPLRRRSKPWR